MKPIIEKILRIALGLVYLLSGFSKSLDFLLTASKIREYAEALSFNFASNFYEILSVVLVITEIAIGFALIFNVLRKIMIYVVLILNALFLVLTICMAMIGIAGDCGCFGNIVSMPIKSTIIKNIVLVAMSLFVCIMNKTDNKVNMPDIEGISVFLFILLLTSTYCLINYSFFSIYIGQHNYTGASDAELLDIESIDGKYIENLDENDTIIIGCLRNSGEVSNIRKKELIATINNLSINRYNASLIVQNRNDNIRKQTNIPICVADDRSLASLQPSNTGIIIMANNNVISKWGQNTFGTRPNPKSIRQLLNNDSMYYVFITIAILWISIYIITYKSRQKRRTEKRKTE